MRRPFRLGLYLTLASAALGSRIDASQEAPFAELASRQASFLLVPPRCAGVLVHKEPAIGLTAAHCVRATGQELDVTFPDGEAAFGVVAAVDLEADLAVLVFQGTLRAQPLELAPAPPQVGEPLYFAGRHDRERALQRVWLERVGPCPTLPYVSDALFTTLDGRPGDSGAPLVDTRLRVVGIVHGGARCRIAAPAAGARQMVTSVLGP